MKRFWLFFLMLTAAACSGSSEPQQPTTQTGAAAAVASTADKIGADATRAIMNPAPAVDVVADDALVRRFAAKDKTLTAVDVQALYASAKNTPYVKDFEALSKVPVVAGTLQFRSADDKYMGLIVARSGPSEGHQMASYSVGIFKDPPPPTRKPYPGETADDLMGCYEKVAAVAILLQDGQPFEPVARGPQQKFSPEQEEEEKLTKAREFLDINDALFGSRTEFWKKDFRKRGKFCS